jgi:hypothetical protein
MSNSDDKIKKCVRCGLDKNLSDFNKDKSKRDGFDKVCRECRKEWKRVNRKLILAYNQDNKERANALARSKYIPSQRVLLTDDEKKRRQREYFKKTYKPSQRVLLTDDEKRHRRNAKKKSVAGLCRYRARQSKELRDGYVKKSIAKRVKCSCSIITSDMIEMERNRLLLVRKIKELLIN